MSLGIVNRLPVFDTGIQSLSKSGGQSETAAVDQGEQHGGLLGDVLQDLKKLQHQEMGELKHMLEKALGGSEGGEQGPSGAEIGRMGGTMGGQPASGGDIGRLGGTMRGEPSGGDIGRLGGTMGGAGGGGIADILKQVKQLLKMMGMGGMGGLGGAGGMGGLGGMGGMGGGIGGILNQIKQMMMMQELRQDLQKLQQMLGGQQDAGGQPDAGAGAGQAAGAGAGEGAGQAAGAGAGGEAQQLAGQMDDRTAATILAGALQGHQGPVNTGDIQNLANGQGLAQGNPLVQAAAQHALQDPKGGGTNEWQKIETLDVANPDGISSIDNIKNAASGALDKKDSPLAAVSDLRIGAQASPVAAQATEG